VHEWARPRLGTETRDAMTCVDTWVRRLRAGRPARRVRWPITEPRGQSRLSDTQERPWLFGWIEDAEFNRDHCRELAAPRPSYGAPCARGGVPARRRHSERFIDDNGAMGGADDHLQLDLREIGGRLGGRESTRDRMHGHRKGDREQQEQS
jgi:hypothetical protein